ncbi:MAG TPA: NAD-dependent epimerase/dehydratase family protein [Pirellulales bacterium]|nr:NAD-dependent epimerase/dehydratase family protein [Pirellulales bacterium]
MTNAKIEARRKQPRHFCIHHSEFCIGLVRSFITGITGFAGAFLAEHLLALGHEVAGCSRRGEWSPDVPPAVRAVPVARWEIGGGDDRAVAEALFRFAPDWVFHLAAIAVPEDCGIDQPTPHAFAVNVLGTANLLNLVANLPARPRVLLASTSHVYAPVTAETFVVAEDDPTRPSSAYGVTKLAAEMVALGMKQAADDLSKRGTTSGAIFDFANLDLVIARAFQHTGPRQDARLMLPSWAKQFAEGADPLHVLNLETYLDLTDVRDTVRAYALLAERGRRGTIYNVGSGRRVRTGEVFEQLRRQADPRRRVVELNPGPKQNWIADTRRLVARTGWTPQIPLEQTIADTLAYWRNKLA